MTKHTPGPWSVYYGEIGAEPGVFMGEWEAARHIVGKNNEPIAWSLWVEADRSLYFGFRTKDDARLIGTAPDLLAALEKLVHCKHGETRWDRPCYCKRKAWAAIHKARGDKEEADGE